MSDSASHPRLQYDVEYPESLSRWMIFVKWLLAIPHYIALAVLGLGVGIVTIIAFFAILITGKYPAGMWNFVVGTLRWSARVQAYVMLERDEYPPFSFDGDYPVQFSLEYPTHLNRWLVLVKWLLVIPHIIVLYFLQLIAQIISLIAFFAILFTAKYPRGLFDFMVGYARWNNRVSAYTLYLTDDYPPFSFDQSTGYTPDSSTGPTAVSYR
ncbi:DUF4389 domain-containing protein [soil metagenome]